MPTSPRSVRFNQATLFVEQKNNQSALDLFTEIWNEFLPNPVFGNQEDREFFFELGKSRALCFMELRSFSDARNIFECHEMRMTLGRLPKAKEFDYWYNYGNVLGNLKEYDDADGALDKALDTAVNLSHENFINQCCYYRMHWFCEAEKWEDLMTMTEVFNEFGSKNEMLMVSRWADYFRAFAEFGVGNINEARDGAEKTLQHFLMSSTHEEEKQKLMRLLRRTAA